MNILKIRQMQEELNEYRENFRQFKLWENNSYFYYEKAKESALWAERYDYGEDENGSFEDSPQYRYFHLQWDEVLIDRVVELYRRLGWEKDELLENCIPVQDYDGESLFYCVEFSKLHEKMQTIGDDIEYGYAVFLLAKLVNDKSETYSTYARKVFDGIKEHDLMMLWDWYENKKVFIAMWFAPQMKQARENIKCAVQHCGYQPVLIDEKKYNGQIVPEIYREIEESAFVIADLTGGRGGVYYEAGYAMAKGKPVILCCKEQERNKVHFDLAQYNTILWKDKKDLYKRLFQRIETTQVLGHSAD